MLLYVPSGGILNILLILMDILEKNMQGLPYFPFSIIAPATGALISLECYYFQDNSCLLTVDCFWYLPGIHFCAH